MEAISERFKLWHNLTADPSDVGPISRFFVHFQLQISNDLPWALLQPNSYTNAPFTLLLFFLLKNIPTSQNRPYLHYNHIVMN